MELLKMQAGIDIVHVPFPGSPQVNTAILASQIQAGFVVPGTAMPLVQSGRLKALAVTSSVRSLVVPELPTVAEAGFPDFESSAWDGMVAPAKTSPAIIERLSRELVTIIRSQDVHEKMLRIYFQPMGTAPEALANLMRLERDRWAKVIKQSGAKAD
jgi:tripartite-type tricarboxylate transporter receptor subunit TctC